MATRPSLRATVSAVTIASGSPPALDTLKMASPTNDAKRIVPSLLQVPKDALAGTSHTGTAAPPGRSIRFSLPPAKKRERPAVRRPEDRRRPLGAWHDARVEA